MEQANLFDFEPETVTEAVNTPNTTQSDTPSAYRFVDRHQKRIWKKGDQHRKRSLAQFKRFTDYLNDPSITMANISSDHVMDFLESMEEQVGKSGKAKVSPKTINRYAATLSSVFKFAVKLGARNDLPYIDYREEGEGRLVTYSVEQIKQIVDYFRETGKEFMVDYCLVAANTGMRRGEIMKIGTDKAIFSGKRLTILDTKNGTDKTVTINDQCYDAAKRIEAGNGFTHRKFYDAWSLCRRDLKLSDEHVFHTFRHSYCTYMANTLNVNPLTLQKMMGHKRLSTTEKYTHVDVDTQEKYTSQIAFG